MMPVWWPSHVDASSMENELRRWIKSKKIKEKKKSNGYEAPSYSASIQLW